MCCYPSFVFIDYYVRCFHCFETVWWKWFALENAALLKDFMPIHLTFYTFNSQAAGLILNKMPTTAFCAGSISYRVGTKCSWLLKFSVNFLCLRLSTYLPYFYSLSTLGLKIIHWWTILCPSKFLLPEMLWANPLLAGASFLELGHASSHLQSGMPLGPLWMC